MNFHRNQAGFTLIELMTALTVFMVVMTIGMGSVLGIFSANRRTQNESSVMNNLNLAIESMAREMRFGSSYHCADSSDLSNLTVAQNCSQGGTLVSFLSSDNQQVVYRFSNTSLDRSTDGGGTFVAVTAPEIILQNLKFYVFGAGGPTLNTLQPKVVIVVKGYSGAKLTERTNFSLQTMVSERKLDNGQ